MKLSHYPLLEKDEVIKLCKPGEGENTCVWLLVSGIGFECSYYYRPSGLVVRWLRNETVAQRDGCEEVKSLGYEVKYVEAPSLADLLERR